jgi:glycosyltransferase involved in cell wall biosynthesis
MKTTIAIPCSLSHVGFLNEAIGSIVNGSILPEEILIAISPVELKKENQILEALKRHASNIKVVFSKEKLNAAMSRDFLTSYISGDIVIYQDADDYQHPQRVEIVKRFFENYDIVHLCHSFNFVCEGCFGNIEYSNIRFIDGKTIYDRVFNSDFSNEIVDGAFGNKSTVQRISAGATCVKREVLDKIKWRDFSYSNCEDYWFCTNVFKTFNKTFFIDSPLYNYRKEP